MKSLTTALTLLAMLCAGEGALAQSTSQPTPSPAPASVPQVLPSIPQGVLNNPIVQSVLQNLGGLTQTTNGNTAHGKVTYFRRFDLQVETASRVFRDVHLHQGTVINPRGTTLEQGMTVQVSGSPNSDGSLNANTIDVLR